jgi:hypothetical protein
LLALSLFASCGGGSDDTGPADGSAATDGSGLTDAQGTDAGGVGDKCTTFADCTDPAFPWCDESMGRCVLCALGSQCASGVCDTATHTCTEAKPDAGGTTDAGGASDTGRDGSTDLDGSGPYDGGHYAGFDAGIPADCTGATCSGHGTCSMVNGKPLCACESGYVPADREPQCAEDNACGGCSARGRCMTWGAESVCACDKGYTPTDNTGRNCRPTLESCMGGAFAWDWNDDGTAETRLDPTDDECWMFEMINYTRATHDPKGAPECHAPLMYSIEWSAHARNHSKKMMDRGSLFHDDIKYSQNCASGCTPDCEMYLYMNGAGEDHCPASTHHCGIMDCGITHVGVGYWPLDGGDYWNTQNFY